MEYPSVILPHPDFKSITCDISNCFLLRIIFTGDRAKIFDEITGKPHLEYICSPRSHIIDFSTSLLGVFLPEHIFIKLTEQGMEKYNNYCEPDTNVESPIYEEDFELDNDRLFWCFKVSDMHEKEFKFMGGKDGKEEVSITSLIRHTPMLWNFWHFSIHWLTQEGIVTRKGEAGSKKIEQKVAHSAMVFLLENLTMDLPDYNVLPRECYCKN